LAGAQPRRGPVSPVFRLRLGTAYRSAVVIAARPDRRIARRLPPPRRAPPRGGGPLVGARSGGDRRGGPGGPRRRARALLRAGGVRGGLVQRTMADRGDDGQCRALPRFPRLLRGPQPVGALAG